MVQSVRLVFPGRVKPQLSRKGRGGLVRRIPARFHSALQSMQDQGRRDSAGQATTAKLAVGLNLDLIFPPAYRRGASAGDKPALMQDAHADSPGYELFMGTKVVDQDTIEIRRELRDLFRAHLPQFKPAGQRLTEPSAFSRRTPIPVIRGTAIEPIGSAVSGHSRSIDRPRR